MALVKDQRPHDHPEDCTEFAYHHLSTWGMFEFNEHEKGNGNSNANKISCSSSLSSPSSTNSSRAFRHAMNHNQQQEGQSVISFKSGYVTDNYFLHTDNGSFLSFEQDDYSSVLDQNQVNQFRGISNVRLLENFSSIQTATGSSTMKGNLNYGDHDSFAWLNSEAAMPSDSSEQELITEEQNFHKRPHTGEETQTMKKQCTSANKKSRPKPPATTQSPSKDPQSIAAKNRRERISERLKTLQDLVPNGSKVDLVTMLEKAISYVKFLQLQVKVLATDEIWPVQGGKAPELSQVKNAIDAILASQRDTNSNYSRVLTRIREI